MAVIKEPPFRRQKQKTGVAAALDIDSISDLEGPRAIEMVKRGLDAKLVRQLANKLELSLEDIGVPLHLTGRTLHRRLESGRLSLDESERILAIAKILTLATATLGSLPKAVHWIKSPVPALAGKTPLECAETQIGLREIEDILIRIEDVVYS